MIAGIDNILKRTLASVAANLSLNDDGGRRSICMGRTA